jgi:hypothetical protein
MEALKLGMPRQATLHLLVAGYHVSVVATSVDPSDMLSNGPFVPTDKRYTLHNYGGHTP